MHHGKHHGEFHGERFHGKDFRDGRHDGPREHFKEGKHFDKKFDFKKGAEFMDSVLQVTHEQKAALEQQRHEMDSTFKALRKQKKDAEKALHEALDSNDEKKIATAKAGILKAQEALLDHRINGVKNFNKILTKEQLEKFKSFHKDHRNKP
jgi:predicted  nucleic acid-binding Zn-ribbon protein